MSIGSLSIVVFSIDVAHELLKDGKVSLENEFIPAAIEELSDACDIFAR